MTVSQLKRVGQHEVEFFSFNIDKSLKESVILSVGFVDCGKI